MEEYAVTIRTERLEMSDGVRLFTRVVTPADGGEKYPTVFRRTPYEEETEPTEETYRTYARNPFIRRGFALVVQHCRGRGGSEGDCVPYSAEERSDGLETLDAIRAMPHYNGEIYLNGTSYSASVLMLFLKECREDVRGVCLAAQTESLYHRNFVNGLCRSYSGFTWWLSMIARHRPKIAEDADIFVRPYRDLMRRATGEDLPAFTQTLLHDRYDDFWKDDPRIGCIETLRVPTLFVGGWYDYYCCGMCRMWEKLAPAVREKSCFLMGPWGHALRLPQETDYPLQGGDIPQDRIAVWFDCLRKNEPYPYGEVGKLRYYSIGEGKWHETESAYAVKPAEAFYLAQGGALTKEPPPKGERSYRYDPETTTHHDRHDYIYKAYPPNAYPDVLSFVSEPFAEEASFVGPVRVALDLSSDCDDTAFFMRLYLVEDGESYNLTDAASTLLHANAAYQKGETCRVDIETTPTAFTLKRGCRIRFDVSSYSDCFNRHANTAEHFALAERTKVAQNTVYFGESAIYLPRRT